MRNHLITHLLATTLLLVLILPGCQCGETENKDDDPAQPRIENANELIPSKDALAFFYMDIKSLSEAMEFNQPAPWREVAIIQELLAMGSKDPVIQHLIEDLFSEGIQDGKVIGSIGFTNNILQLYNGAKSEEGFAEEWHKLLSFDVAVVSTSIPLLVNALKAEGVLEASNATPKNQYGFHTQSIEDITIGWCDTILMISSLSSGQLGKPHKENLGSFAHHKELSNHEASILFNLPVNLSKSLTRAIPILGTMVPDLAIPNGMERMIIDLIEGFDFVMYSADVEDSSLRLATEVQLDPSSKYAQIVFSSCDGLSPIELPLRKVSPIDDNMLYGFGNVCLDYLEALDKEYDYFNGIQSLQEGLKSLTNEDPISAMINIPDQEIKSLYKDLTGEYAFSFNADENEMHFNLFVGMNSMLSEGIQEELDGMLSLMALIGILPPESTTIDYTDDGIYLVSGKFAEDIEDFKENKWPQYPHVTKEHSIGCGAIDVFDLMKTFGYAEDYSSAQPFEELLGNLELELLSDASTARSSATLEWKINRDNTNADQGTLWVLLSPLFEQF